MKSCARCLETKAETAFHSRGNGKRESICGVCRAEVRRIKGRSKRQETSEERRTRWLWETYKLTSDQYQAMFDGQGGVCAVCRQPPAGDKPLAVDHCHTTRVVRALLCNLCNLMIGVYEQNRETAAAYLAAYADGNPLLTRK
jgi:hypothetical protein